MALTSKTYKNRTAARVNFSAILTIIVGVLVIAFPAILAWAVGIYLIIMGVLELLPR